MPQRPSRTRNAPRRRRLCGVSLTPADAAGPAPATRHRVLLEDGAVRIDVIVEGCGPALVLLPSSQRDSEDFDAFAALLAARGFKVLRPQPRGMRGSSGPMDALNLSVLAGDVATTVTRLGGGRAVLIGHAFGHFVARVTDLENPALVRGVVVAAGAARVFPDGMTAALSVASDPTQPRTARLQSLQRAFFAPGNDPSSWLEGWHPDVRAAYRRAGAVPAKERWWPVCSAPILDLQGDADPWRPAATRNELKDVLADQVTVHVIAHASHALIAEQPQAVAAAITAWVASLPD